MRLTLCIVGMMVGMTAGHAQHGDRRLERSELDRFREEVRKELGNFRQQCFREYVDFMRNPWQAFGESPAVDVPEEKRLPLVVMPEEERKTPAKDRTVVIEEVVEPMPSEPQPQPVEPIEEVPVKDEQTVAFTFFGTAAKVRCSSSDIKTVRRIDENGIADAMGQFIGTGFDNMLADCLALRSHHRLCDWAYLLMLKAAAETAAGKDTNEAALLTAWLYMQSGYKMRLATDGAKLYMLFASRHRIYRKAYYTVDGDDYYGVGELPGRLFICRASFPGEHRLSLLVGDSQRLAEERSEPRTIVSERYPDVKMTVTVNKNLLDFYSSYPTSMIGGNEMTRWAMYANTPLEPKVRNQAYGALQRQLEGLSQQEAAERLLNLVQTGLTYEYDDKVWGYDRTFFAEETLCYPYCDCEDRSVLFARLVRDLLRVKVALVYYPGHLATAVAFDQAVEGDHITLDGKRYTICDPTYIGAPVGRTMTGMDNVKAKAIILDNHTVL